MPPRDRTGGSLSGVKGNKSSRKIRERKQIKVKGSAPSAGVLDKVLRYLLPTLYGSHNGEIRQRKQSKVEEPTDAKPIWPDCEEQAMRDRGYRKGARGQDNNRSRGEIRELAQNENEGAAPSGGDDGENPPPRQILDPTYYGRSLFVLEIIILIMLAIIIFLLAVIYSLIPDVSDLTR